MSDDSPAVQLCAPLAIDGLVCVVMQTEDEQLIVPMGPATAEEFADRVRMAAITARAQRPDRVV